MKMKILKQHAKAALAYFFMAGMLGLLLRLFFVSSLPITYRYVVHGHSHIALLGWAYIGLSTLIYTLYFNTLKIHKKYRMLFWVTQITLLGMLFTFPFQGYAWLSITFSTSFLIVTYFFAGWVFKNISVAYKKTASYQCIKAALWYMVISSMGPWALGAIMATVGNTSIWYKMAIYFYLHFQYNAWFLLALVGMLFYVLEKAGLPPSKAGFSTFYRLINGGILLSFFLSVLWVEPHPVFYFLAATGAVLQILAFYRLYLMLNSCYKILKPTLSPIVLFLLLVAGSLLVVKLVLQLFTAFPYGAALAYAYTDLVIGYLHLVFLGVVSIGLFAFLHHFLLLTLQKWIIWLYLAGFLLSEVLIFYKGISIWLRLPFFSEYFFILLIFSSLIPMAVGLLLYKNLQNSFRKKE